ncbi:interferon gamma receptor 1-like isoform X2 [Engraulis encrasicolus]|uniref:interferon gamma receptor 1-like isoform X2 n=1 Tax=Engraulis encrasicolus TaxID=184585 RepID=UPI002FD6A528
MKYVSFPPNFILAPVATAPELTPPDNLTISCRNGTNVAYWNYTDPPGAGSFLVKIFSYTEGEIPVFFNETKEHHIDISPVVHDLKEVYTLSLVANNGTAKSSETKTSFSYSSDYDHVLRCYMDFPTPTLQAEENRITFKFANPCFYGYEFEHGTDDGTHKCPDDDFPFTYSIYTSHDEKESQFECSKELCEGEIPVNLDNCTSLELRGDIDTIGYRTSKDFCNPTPQKGAWPILLIVVICVTVIAGLVGLLLGMRKLAKDMIKSYGLPSTLHSRPASAPQRLLHPEPTQGGHTPLLLSPKDSPTDTPITIVPPEGSREQTHFPITSPEGSPEQTHFSIRGTQPPSGDHHDDDGDKNNLTSLEQPGSGYEARLGGVADSDPEPEEVMCERKEDAGDDDDGYMQRERFGDDSDGRRRSLVIEMAPGDCVSGYEPTLSQEALG